MICTRFVLLEKRLIGICMVADEIFAKVKIFPFSLTWLLELYGMG